MFTFASFKQNTSINVFSHHTLTARACAACFTYGVFKTPQASIAGPSPAAIENGLAQMTHI